MHCLFKYYKQLYRNYFKSNFDCLRGRLICIVYSKKISKFIRNDAKKSDEIIVPCDDSPFITIQIDQQIFHALLFLPFVS